jgi:hypothetical protein
MRWLEDAENDLRELKVNTWRRKANNKWASAAKEAKFVEPRSKYVTLYTKFEIFKEAIILSGLLFPLNHLHQITLCYNPKVRLFTSHGFALSDSNFPLNIESFLKDFPFV